ncbi:MAG: hypothetical protein J6P16_00260 [Eubacterium sp.]|nr:hypothetical protein [Eubacterium sp.]
MMWNKKKRSVRIIRVLTCFILIFGLFVTGSIREYGPIVAQAIEDSTVTYVSEIRLFYSTEGLADARAACEAADFIPVDGDLNEGTDRNNVVMGYKETDERNEAICSIKLLAMNDGYEMRDFSELQKEYKSSNSSVIDTIEAAAMEFISNYNAESPKAILAYQGLNLIHVPEAGDKLLGDYIVDGDADWDFYANIVTRSSTGTVNNVLSNLSLGISPYKNEYDPDTGEEISVCWAEFVKDSLVWDMLDEAVTEDEFDEMYREYGDDAREFHKELQEFTTGYENALATFDENELVEEIENLEGKTDEEVIEEKEKLTAPEKDMIYISVYDKLDQYKTKDGTSLAEYLTELGGQTSDEVDLTALYPIIDSMTYAERRFACMSGLQGIIQTVGENEENKETEQIEEKISEASVHLDELIGTGSYSIWLNDNEEIKDKKVAYTSDAIRADAAQGIIDQPQEEKSSEVTQNVFKWVNMALGIVSCVLTLAKFEVIAHVIAFIPAGLSKLAAAMGLIKAATSVATLTTKIAGGAAAASGPLGLITMAVMVWAIVIVLVVCLIEKYIKEQKDYDYEDAPEYVADRVEIEGENGYTTYYKGAGSQSSPNDEMDDYHGEDGISDVNGRRGFRGWNCIFYSKDKNAGSPIVIKDGVAPFKIFYGNDGMNIKSGYDCVRSFGEVTPGNCNNLMKEDEKGGVFIHYRTEDSINGISNTYYGSVSGSAADVNDGTKQSGLYYTDIIVRSADTEAAAKAKIKVKGYKVLDINLANDARFKYSPNEEWAFTYLGFKSTTNPKQAIRDIRVATFYPNTRKEILFGSIKYGCAGNLGYKAEDATEDKEYPSDLDGLWFTRDERAGTPIEVGGLHVVSDHADGKYVNDGWIPVTTFSGVPYNFASTRMSDTDSWEPGRMGNYGYNYTGYVTREDNQWNCQARYIYYEPLEKYTSGTKYLSAMFFTFGSDSESTAAKVGETLANYTDLVDRMKNTPNTVVLDNNNLASSFVYKGYIVESNQKYMHLGYSWSYNPYRALTDIRAFQGTIYTANLPYSINKPWATGNVAYDSVTVVSQRSITAKSVVRGIGPENAYMFPSGLLGTNKQVPDGYTSYQPGNYKYSRKHMAFISSGLYVSGPVDGAEKLTLDDVIISSNAHDATNNGGVITCDVSTETTLGGIAAAGEWNSMQEMKNPFELKPFNVAYPEWTNDNDEHQNAGTPCYIYLRKPALKKKYISSVTVGSFSAEDAGVEDEEVQKKEIGKQIDLNALLGANGAGADEVIPENVSVVRQRAWYDTQIGGDTSFNSHYDSVGGVYERGTEGDIKEDTLPWCPPAAEILIKGSKSYDSSANAQWLDRPASYVSVTRTDDPNKAVRGLLLFKSKDEIAAEKIQVGGVEYTCASTSTPIIMSKCTEGDLDDAKAYEYMWETNKYFLYYTTNRGVTPGQPITEITIDEEIFNTGQATVLCVDKKDKVETSADGRKKIAEKAIPFGEGDMPKYIHATFEKDTNMYYNKIYTATGETKRDALAQLLEQGCTEYLDINLNDGVILTDEDKDDDDERKGGEFIYFGYRGFSIKGGKNKDDQLVDAVYDIICTVGEKYHPEGIMTERFQIQYTPVVKVDKTGGLSGSNLNAGTNGPAIYMYYTTPWIASKYNDNVGNDTRKNRSANPKDYLKSPITRICFTKLDRVPYNPESGVDAEFDDDTRAWEYVLYDDSRTPVDLNDGTIKFNSDYLTENNKINMFVQREEGNVKPSAEITGGYVSGKAQIGEMWLNR